ncbi:MAG: hypothetical protein HFE45_08160 [Oscillospiraceae bacterium]|jgi:hypothetical protein|nr:hypothetical protein [Oscillospiraceae bacterium]
MKEKMTAIFNAFEGYIGNQDVFDIVYSKKYGYVWVFPEDDFTEVFKTPERMLERLCFDLIGEVVFSPQNPDGHYETILTEYDRTESRRRLMEILSTIETEEKADELITYYLDKYQERYKMR